MEGFDLIAVGDVLVDVTVSGTGHLGNVRIRPGGSSANVAVWAAAAGARAAVVGRVGDDAPGRLVRHELEERGVRAFLAVDAVAPTGAAVATGDALVVDRGATARLAPADVPAELPARVVVVSGYALFQPGSAAAARAALERARAEWAVIDVAGRAISRSESLPPATAVIANEEAARALTGTSPVDAVRTLGRSFRLACVTRGAAGAVASLDGELASAAVPAVEPAEETGAGDAFAAGLMLSLIAGAALEEALDAGCRVGAVAAASPEPWPDGAIEPR